MYSNLINLRCAMIKPVYPTTSCMVWYSLLM